MRHSCGPAACTTRRYRDEDHHQSSSGQPCSGQHLGHAHQHLHHGYEEDTPSGNYGGFSTAGGGITLDGNHYAPAMAFQLTLTNPGSATADVGSIAIAFYDASGTEQSSVNALATRYITGGQSLTWTVRSPLATDGSGTGDQGDQADSTIPVTASSCSLVQWETP